MTKPVPDGFTTITPHIVVDGAAKAIDFYKKAFGAEELSRMASPDGKVMHATLRIGTSMIMLNDEFPEWGVVGPKKHGGTACVLSLYVDDADAAYKRAVDAGAESTMPVAEQFWGDRYGKLKDPFGHEWSVATHVKDLTPEEIAEAGRKAFSQDG